VIFNIKNSGLRLAEFSGRAKRLLLNGFANYWLSEQGIAYQQTSRTQNSNAQTMLETTPRETFQQVKKC
jgi:hypothetical protein